MVFGRDLLLIFGAMLELLSNRRRVGRFHSDNPTDREWLFCVAAATVLIHNDVAVDAGAMGILARILHFVRENNELWQKFMGYQAICYSIDAALTDRQI